MGGASLIAATMAKIFCLLLGLAAGTALVQPCRGLPLDTREHKLMLWEESTRGKRNDDLCFLCQVSPCTAPARYSDSCVTHRERYMY